MSEPMTESDRAAIRARLDAATARDVGPDDADIDAEMDRVRSARLVLDGLAPVDLRELLDENARLNAKVDSLIAHNGVLVTEIRFQADRAEKARVERDALAAKVEAVEKAVKDSWPWRCDSPAHNTICHLRALTPVNVALGYGPGMPHPPAQDGHSGTETPGTGSGRGTGVAETPGTAQESEGGNDA